MRQLLFERGCPPITPTTLYGDNKSAINISQNGYVKSGTKHMDVRCHSTRDQITDNIIVKCMPTESMFADILTKPVNTKCFFILQLEILGNLV